MKHTEEEVFCFKYLQDRKLLTKEALESLGKDVLQLTTSFELVKVDKDFFEDLAKDLRKLWPPGDKDGKYPWRGSVPDLAIRLRVIWTHRKLDRFTKDDCLRVARKYLSAYEDNAKYMKTLKYWIYRQEKLVDKKGITRYTYNSSFADMLENSEKFAFEEWMDEATAVAAEGELI